MSGCGKRIWNHSAFLERRGGRIRAFLLLVDKDACAGDSAWAQFAAEGGADITLSIQSA